MAGISEELEMACFGMISYVGMAKSCYIQAVSRAKAGDFDGAAALMAQGEESFARGHAEHAKLIQTEAAAEEPLATPLILLHAEDQMMSAETCKLMATELIDVHRELAALRA